MNLTNQLYASRLLTVTLLDLLAAPGVASYAGLHDLAKDLTKVAVILGMEIDRFLADLSLGPQRAKEILLASSKIAGLKAEIANRFPALHGLDIEAAEMPESVPETAYYVLCVAETMFGSATLTAFEAATQSTLVH